MLCPTDFARTLTLFLTDFLPGQRNVSPHTIASYRDTFKQFLLFMQEKQQVRPERISFATLTAPSIKDFLQWLETSRQVSISTRNQRLAAIHSFFRFAQAENPEILFESHLTLDQLACLFEQPDTSTKKGRRNLALMVVLYDAGARVQELIDLKVCDVRLFHPAMITLTGKGNKKRNIPITAKTRNLLEGYMTENHLLDMGRQQSPLFYNSRYQAFTRPCITYILGKYMKQAKRCNKDKVFP